MAPFVVGLTGGIGSGKTAVSDRFQAFGIHVVDGDQASRAALRARVFADDAERRWLEQLTHPLMAAWLAEQIVAATSPYCLLVNPLLVESGQAQRCSRVLVVDAPEAAQLERTMARDGNSEEQVRAIMAAQADRERCLAAADDGRASLALAERSSAVIVNDRDLAHLDAEVARLHERYLELAADE